MTEALDEHLAYCRSLFLTAFPGEDDTFARIEAGVRSNRVFIELSADRQSFVVLQPVRDLHVWTVGGTIEGVLELEENVSRRAAEGGFDRMTALPSRNGWDRALLERGWKSEAKLPLVKEL
jgi:Fe-S cluster assembly scaffold protein SufB